MRIKSAVGSVVGETSATRWSQVLTLPHAYAVVEVEDDDGVARNHGVRLLTELTHRLEKQPVSLSDVRTIASDVFDEGTLTVAVLVPVGNVLYISLRGEGTVLLKRKDLLATLLTREGGISGEVEVGDTVLVASAGIKNVLSREDIGSTFDHLPAVEAAEKLTLLLHQRKEPRFGAALVFQIQAFLEADAYGEEIPEQQSEPPVQIRASVPEAASRRVLRGLVRRIRRRQFPTVSGIRRRAIALIQNRKRSAGLAAAVLVLLFVASVVLGLLKQTGSRTNSEFEAAFANATLALDEGKALRELNPGKSRERIGESVRILEPFLDRIPEKSKEGQKLRTLYTDAKTNYQLVLKRFPVKPELFYDVSLLKKDARAGAISLYEGTIGIVDVSAETVYALDIASKNAGVIGGGTAFRGMRLIGMTADVAYVLSSSGIFKIPVNGTAAKSPVIPKDSDWGNIGALVPYGGNLYLLDTTRGRIWKYTGTEQGFSERREYLTADTLPDLSKTTGMAIDGSVYMGGMEGDVRKFSGGVEASFTITGVDPPLTGVVYVYTDDTLAHVYVMEKQGRRIVVLDKDGVYVAQYVWEEPIIPSMFAVSEQLKKALLLSDGLIHSFSLE